MTEKKIDDIIEKIQRYKAKNSDDQTTPKKNISAANIVAELVAGCLAGFLFGNFLDYLFDTKPFFLVFCLLLGTVSSLYIVFKTID